MEEVAEVQQQPRPSFAFPISRHTNQPTSLPPDFI